MKFTYNNNIIMICSLLERYIAVGFGGLSMRVVNLALSRHRPRLSRGVGWGRLCDIDVHYK